MHEPYTDNEGSDHDGEAQKNVGRRVFAIPELLSLILQHCGKHELAMSAAVCQGWEFSALRLLWHTVEDDRNLFALLAPLVANRDGLLTFEHHVDAHKWPRFERYAALVRILRPTITSGLKPSSWLYAEIYRLAGISGRPVFPNLIELKHSDWGQADIHYLLRPSITTLELTSGNATVSYLVHLAQLFVEHIPRVSKLCWDMIYGSNWSNRGTEDFVAAIRRLTSIVEFTTSMNVLTSLPIWAAVGDLPKLQSLHCFWAIPPHDPLLSAQKMTFRRGTFASLQYLSLCLTGEGAVSLLRSNIPPTLTSFKVQLMVDNSTDTHIVFDLLAQNMLQLSELTIDLRTVTSAVNLRHLINRSKNWAELNTLDIIVAAPLDLDDEGVEVLAAALPRISRLALGSHPTIKPLPTSALITPKSLEILAAAYPGLSVLYIYIQTDQSNPAAVRTIDLDTPVTPYTALRSLNLGTSPLRTNDMLPIAKWLSAVCPDTTTRIGSFSSPIRHRTDDVHVRSRYAAVTKRWANIAPIITELRTHNATVTRSIAKKAARVLPG